MGRRRGIGAATAVVLALLGAGCSDDGDSDDGSGDETEPTTQFGAPVLPDEVVCNLYFRPHENDLVGYEEAVVRVPRGDGVLAGGSSEQVIGTMRFAASYLGDVPDGRGVHVRVFGADDALIMSALYQLGGQDEFPVPTYAGGHGFTGLHHVNDGEAELQFWCDAE